MFSRKLRGSVILILGAIFLLPFFAFASTITCDFSSPVYWDEGAGILVPNSEGGSKPISNWAFSKMTCTGEGVNTTTTDLITNGEQSFFLNKTFTYGDFLVIAFLIIILVVLVIYLMRDFVKNRKLERL